MASNRKFDLVEPKSDNKLLLLVLIISFLLAFWSLGPHLWDRYRVSTDTHTFYWMARIQDPTLFARDYLEISSNFVFETNILGFYLPIYLLGPGYGLFFYLLSTLIDYIWLSKWIALLLLPICVVYLFKLGKLLDSALTGVSLSLLFVFFILASPLSLSIASGVQRAFALPLYIIFLYYLIRRQYLGAALMIFISALIYLPNFPPMVLAYLLLLVKVERPFRLTVNAEPFTIMPLGISLLLSIVIVAFAVAARLDLSIVSKPAVFPSVTNIVENEAVSKDPVFQPKGQAPLFLSFPFLGRAGVFDMGADVTNFLVMLVFAFLIYKALGPRSIQRMPREIWILLVAGIIMYTISLFFVFEFSSFALYLPSRYTRSTLFLTAFYFAGLNWVDFLHELPNWLRRNIRLLIFFILTLSLALGIVYILTPNRPLLIPTFWLVGLMISSILAVLGGSLLFWLATHKSFLKTPTGWSILFVIGIIVVYLGTVYIQILGVKTTNPSEHERDIYEFVATLPKDAVLVGDPDIMTNIPLFSKRSVLFRSLFPRRDAPVVEYFDTQYAETAQDVLEFCQQYQITYFVLDIRDFSPDYVAKGEFFYQPWNSRIVARVTNRSNFVLPQLEPIFVSGPLMVIKCDAETILANN